MTTYARRARVAFPRPATGLVTPVFRAFHGSAASTNTTTTVRITLTAPVTAGSSLLLAVMTGGGGGVSGVTDSKNQTWVKDAGSASATARNCSIWRVQSAVAMVAGDTVTATATLLAGQAASLGSWSPLGVLRTPTAADSGQSVTTTTLTPAGQAGDLLVSALGAGGSSAAPTPVQGTVRLPWPGNGVNVAMLADLTVAGSTAAAWTLPASATWATAAACYAAV